jgi:hypothetical protein
MPDTPTATADPPIEVEVVDEVPEAMIGTDIEPVTPSPAIERATEAALMPGAAGRDEFLSLAMQARVLSMSGAAPKAVRNNPYVALHLALIGRDLGISPSAAIELIDVIGEGDKTQMALSPQLLKGQVRRLGLGDIRRKELTLTSCTAEALDPQGNVLGESTFTWEDAQVAGLVNRSCTSPRDHKCAGLDWKKQCRGGWLKYPKRMLWWRACGYAVDDFFPEAGLGLYTAEELGAEVDEEGRPIDPSTVPLPEGYESGAPPVEPMAAPDLVDGLKARIANLSDEDRAALIDEWKTQRIPPLAQMTQRAFPAADRLVQAKVIAAHQAAEAQAREDEDTVRTAFGVHETAPGAPVSPADPPPASILPDDLAEALRGVPDATIDAAVESVRLLPLKAVTSALQMRGVEKPTGNLDAKRAYLAGLIAIEAHAQEVDPLDPIG